MTLLAQTLHGSRLYRLDNANSDIDLKRIYLPSQTDCLLFRAARNVHETAEVNGTKVETEAFALQEFLKLAARGEDFALCMLHCQDSDVQVNSPTFQYLRDNRKSFYTKEMKGALGYARSQSARFALRADRMDTVISVIEFLETSRDKGVARIGQIWDDLPDIAHTRRFINDRDRAVDKRIYEVVGKGFKPTMTPDYALEILYQVRDNYGERVRLAREMGKQDYKALSHSFRTGYQLLHLFRDGDFSFPLPETDFIRAVKEGRANYVDDKLDEKLNDLIAQVEFLSEQSNYPESVNQDWLDEIILNAYSAQVTP